MKIRSFASLICWNFFVAAVIAKWCKIVGSDAVAAYSADATAAMLDVRSKIFNRKRPQKP